ncbi:MAG: bifunctional metallophosphatase/5'-nucleotidase [Desulfobaccales bacterium]
MCSAFEVNQMGKVNSRQVRWSDCLMPIGLGVLVIFLAVFGMAAGGPAGADPERVAVQILAFNDFHGQIIAGKKVNGRPVGSAPVLAAYLKKARQEFRGHSFIVHAGDLVGASPPASALLKDEPAIMFMNLLGNQECSSRDRQNPRANLVGTLGNHEFDKGVEELKRLIEGGNHPEGPFLQDPWPGAAFPYVSANVVRQDTGKTILPPYVIKEVEGIPVAFIGAVLKATKDMVMPSHLAGLEILDEAEAVNALIPALRDQGVRSIIVLLHQGGKQTAYQGPTQPEARLTGPIKNILWRLDDEVDVVISGHTHAFTNALVPNRNGKKILVTQAWSYGQGYADIKVEISRATRDVVKKYAAIVTTWADAGPGLTPDPEAARLTAAAEERVAPLTNRKIGEAAADLSRMPNRAGESALGNFIADAQRQALGTDMAFMNPGGMRTDLAAGEVTWGKLYAVQPFNNNLVKMRLTGQQIYDLLEQQFPPTQAYPRMLQISGLTYTWDAAGPRGRRVVEVRFNRKPLDRGASYTVTTNSFLAEGGDRFSVFTQGIDKVAGPLDLEALIKYIQSLPQHFSAKIEGRIERLN